MSEMSWRVVDKFMNPESAAVIGASNNPGSAGYMIIKNLIGKYKGKIYPVNPKYDEVLGLKCYHDIREINDKIEVAILAVPNTKILNVIEGCGKKKVKNIIIISSGFEEIGEEGKKINENMMSIAKEYDIRIMGPNTTGVINMENGFTSTFVKIPDNIKKGNVSLIVQTGIFAATLLRWIFTSENFGISKVIGLGNKIDIDDAEALEYLLEDEKTEVILIYMEGVKEGRKLFETAKKFTGKKPIVLIKSARTPYGEKASQSHTGSLAVSDRIFDAVCRQTNMIRAKNVDEALDIVKFLSFYGLVNGKNIGVASYSGAECVMSSDAIYENNLNLAELEYKTFKKILEYAPPYWPRSHPIDLGPIMETDDPLQAFLNTIKALLDDKNPDIYLFILPVIHESEGNMMETGGIETEILYEDMMKMKKRYPDKKIVVVLDGSLMGYMNGKRLLENIGIPVYKSVERAVYVISKALAPPHV